MPIDKTNSRYKFLQTNKEPKDKSSVTLERDLDLNKRRDNMIRLWRYKQMWDAMSNFRQRRRRNKEYFHGNQWEDIIKVGTESMTEAENIRRQGKVPLKNNVISSTVSSILGVYRQGYGKPEVIARVRDNQKIGEMNTCMAEYIYQINNMKEIDAKDLLEAIISGMALQMTDYQYDHSTHRKEEIVMSWNPTRVFMNGGIEDPRGGDIHTIGVLMDMSKEEVIQRFARTKEDAMKIEEIYKSVRKDTLNNAYSTFTHDSVRNMDFFMPTYNDQCRVIQAWELESEECWLVHDHYEGTLEMYPLSDEKAINKMIEEREKDIDDNGLDYDSCKIEKQYTNDIFWYVRYLSPIGDILYEARTPFNHESHPFSIYLGHLIDGEIHSFVENIIDQQRYINRLITMIDFIMGSSAKGVLVFPENAIPVGMNKEDILEQWTSYNGVIFANLKPGMALPQQISTNATNIGANEMLSLQLQLVRDISGIHGALQGKEAKSGTAASLYAQEASNAQVNIADLLESFTAFRQQRDYKLVKIAPQCYDEEFYINLAGRDYSDEAKQWNPSVAASADVYINLEESQNTSTYRMMANQILIKAMEMRLVDFETVLESGGVPNGDKILHVIERRKQAAQEEMARQQAMMMQGQALGTQMKEAGATDGQVMQAGADVAMQELQNTNDGNAAEADPRAMQLIQQALAGE